MAKFCRHCGAQVDENEKFCHSCGGRLKDDAPAASVQGHRGQPKNYASASHGYEEDDSKASPLIPLIIVLSVIILIAAGVVAFLFINNKKNDAIEAGADNAVVEQSAETDGQSEIAEGTDSNVNVDAQAENNGADGNAGNVEAQNNADGADAQAEGENASAQEQAADNGGEIAGSDQNTENSSEEETDEYIVKGNLKIYKNSNSSSLDSENGADYILPESNTRLYTKAELKEFSAEELRIARNEIYARYGRKFKDEALQSYFDSKDWYIGVYTPEEFDKISNTILSDTEKTNAELIKEVEDSKKD